MYNIDYHREWRGKNRSKCVAATLRWAHKNPEKARLYKRRHNLRRRGVSIETYDAMFMKQNGLCAICARPSHSKRALSIDHDHNTGKNRGLLCDLCNRTLVGCIEKYGIDPRKIVEYLEKYAEK